jgi:hypothetical protein
VRESQDGHSCHLIIPFARAPDRFFRSKQVQSFGPMEVPLQIHHAECPVRPAVVGSTLHKLSRMIAIIVMLMIGRDAFPAVRIRRTLIIVHLSPDLGSGVHLCMVPGPVMCMSDLAVFNRSFARGDRQLGSARQIGMISCIVL